MKKISIVLIGLVMGLCSICYGQKASLPFPVVVAQRSLIGQTGNIPITTLLTPKRSGFFRISGYAVPLVTDGNAGGDVWFSYSDDAGPEAQDFPFLAGGPGCNVQGVYPPLPCYYSTVLRAVAKVPIQITVTTYGSLTYDLFITLEQLQ